MTIVEDLKEQRSREYAGDNRCEEIRGRGVLGRKAA